VVEIAFAASSAARQQKSHAPLACVYACMRACMCVWCLPFDCLVGQLGSVVAVRATRLLYWEAWERDPRLTPTRTEYWGHARSTLQLYTAVLFSASLPHGLCIFDVAVPGADQSSNGVAVLQRCSSRRPAHVPISSSSLALQLSSAEIPCPYPPYPLRCRCH